MGLIPRARLCNLIELPPHGKALSPGPGLDTIQYASEPLLRVLNNAGENCISSYLANRMLLRMCFVLLYGKRRERIVFIWTSERDESILFVNFGWPTFPISGSYLD